MRSVLWRERGGEAGEWKQGSYSLTTMEELRALCGEACSAASVVASIVRTHSLSLDVDEFEFAKNLLVIVAGQSYDGKQVPKKHKDEVVRYLVEMCDWRDISGHEENAVSILGYVLLFVANRKERTLCDELQRTLGTFTREVVQRIQDGSPSFNLFRDFFIEVNVPVTTTLARYGLTIIPDAVLFDVRVNDDNSPKNTIETPITEMIIQSEDWQWDAGSAANYGRLGVFEFLRICFKRMPERGFLSRKEKVAPGKYQFVLHSILYAITQAHSKYGCSGDRTTGTIDEVLPILFQTPRVLEDIKSIRDETSYYYFEPPGHSKPRWVGLTLEDMIRQVHPYLLSVLDCTMAKGAFEE